MTGVADAMGTVGDAHVQGPATTCLNCGAALAGRYCHDCGQSSHVHRTLASIGHDLLHGVFHFEGKIWRTLPMLVLRPGQLTRRYIEGERARFVSPLALFLFTVFLMFAAFSTFGSGSFYSGLTEGMAASTTQLDEARAKLASQIAAADRERAALVAAKRPTAEVDKKLAELRSDAAAANQLKISLNNSAGGQVKVRSDVGWLDQGLKKAKENPGLIFYKAQSSGYKFSWALILLSTPLVALLFLWRRRFGMYDHATFVTYSISFMSLLVIAVQLLAAAGATTRVVLPMLLVPPVHMFVQLRGAYGLRWFSALWRTVALLLFSSIALTLFTVGVIAMEVSG